MTLPFWNSFANSFALFTLLIIPGLAWKGLFWDPDQEFFERLAEIIGVSISLTALGALVLFLLDWPLRSVGLAGLALFILPLAARGLRSWALELQGGYRSGSGDIHDTITLTRFLKIIKRILRGDHVPWIGAVISAGVFVSILIWRFYQSRSLVFPAWVDSIHHTLIVRLFLENGGLPDTFEPYMPVPFYYHFAFHAVTAAFAFLSGARPEQAVLWIGQVFNALISLGIYRLVKVVWEDRRRAVLAALLVGFVIQMPAYYVTWGRYTLLTGMLVLPVAMAAAVEIANHRVRISRLATLAILIGGLLLTHYFAAALLAIFLAILSLQAFISDLRGGVRLKSSLSFPLMSATVIGVGLALPWLIRAWDYSHRMVKLRVVSLSLEMVDQVYFPEYLNYLWRLLGPLRNQVLLAPALLGLALAMFRPKSRGFAIWVVVLCLLSQPWGVYLAPFRPDHAVIVLFLPMAVLIADLLFSLVDWKNGGKLGLIKAGLIFGLCAGLLGWGAWETRVIINSGTILAGEADRRAIEWIEQNTPPDANFFINVNHWQFGIYRGSDGGWWITPLTGRKTLLPVALYPMGDRTYVTRVNQLAEKASQMQGCTPEFWEVIRSEKIDYVYLTLGKGSVHPESLSECPGMARVYGQEGIFIYQVIDGLYD